MLLHVIDAGDPERDDHIEVVDRLIAQLAKPGVPVIQAFNKCDTVQEDDIPRGENIIAISAIHGTGMDALLQLIEKNLDRGLHHVTFLLPYAMGGQLDMLHSQAKVLGTDYTADGIQVECICDEMIFGRLKDYIME